MLKHHHKIEKNSILLLILTAIVISIGGLIEIAPLFRLETTIEKVEGVRPDALNFFDGGFKAKKRCNFN
jgi:cytochrome c oxidase cbb3-type subunit 2